jgi:hypothetical protein
LTAAAPPPPLLAWLLLLLLLLLGAGGAASSTGSHTGEADREARWYLLRSTALLLLLLLLLPTAPPVGEGATSIASDGADGIVGGEATGVRVARGRADSNLLVPSNPLLPPVGRICGRLPPINSRPEKLLTG